MKQLRKEHSKLVSILICMLIVTFGCAREPQPVPRTVPAQAQSPFVYDARIGIAELRNEETEGCLAVYHPSIPRLAKVTLVDQPHSMQLINSPSVNEAQIVDRLSQECGNRLATGNSSGPSYYRIQTSAPWQGNSHVFAILDSPSPIILREGRAEGDLDQDGENESFRICSSSEGVHYQVWTGVPLQGRPRWHWYVYAGYDMEPSCTEKDYFGPKEQQK